jgi:RecG-like helicase/REP element-mobilizing transposase RayT
MFDVILEEEDAHALSPPLLCRWFNAHWVEKMIVHGQRVVVYGRPKRSGTNVVIAHPEFEVVEEDAEASIHLQRIVPIHGATEGLSPRVLRRLIWDVLEKLPPGEVEPQVPEALDATPPGWALRQIHFPDSWETRDGARRHLVLGEFFAMQLSIAAKRAEQTAQPGAIHCTGDALLQRLHAALPFPLTGAQLRSIAEIRADLASPRPMNRLLHGDVGSGKTLVALSAMLLAVEAGWQAALMAPTQILAEQHYLTLRHLCEPLGLRVALRTAARSEDSGELPLFAQGNAALRSAAVGDPPTAPGGTGGPPVAVGGSPAASAHSAASQPGDIRYAKRNLPHFERPWAKYTLTFRTISKRQLSPAARTKVLDCLLHWNSHRYELYAACVMPDHVHLLIEPSIEKTDENGAVHFFPLTTILHTIKSYTAHQINELEKCSGPLWQDERYDQVVRSQADLEEKFSYICQNPWAAGLVEEGEDYLWLWYPGRDLENWWVREMQRAGAGAPVVEAGRLDQRASGPFHPGAAAPLRDDSAPHILVGTHALLYERAGISELGLAVIDEQHKFGVLQRARLRDQGVAPDVLVMTATPIPRTLTMTLYGDLDVSTLDELPKNRGKIVTAVRAESKLPEAVKFFREHLEAGRQAYIVYPLIDESEKLEAKAAVAEFKKWQELLAPMKCELLHGRIAPEEKDAIMERFRRGETKALIATTVIEVGIDVPNANLMLIENAERFGLAQLHQLRGRIGRGEHKSYCILLHGAKAEAEALEKLRIVEETSDGFKIAEADLRLRGPGDILGTAQSGLPPLKLGNLLTDHELMRLARNAAFLLFERDPQLAAPENARYRRVLAEGRKLLLSQVS